MYQGETFVKGEVTDIDGTFVINEVPVGRYRVKYSYIGKETIEEDFELKSSREGFLETTMRDMPETLGPVIVKAGAGEPVNSIPVASANTITPAQIELSTANAGDMGRFAMALPGVQAARDTRSDIIIRGNSLVGLLWRLEGIDIPNPNHFARRGSSGGGITIFSLSMLDRSDFSTGAFAPEYGNAFAGVFDVRFRKGNNQTREYTFKAGILGLDFATEGPFKQGGASYSLNYRYSTLGILNSIGLHLVGERIDNTFQDLSFKMHFPGKKAGNSISLWGIGGLSTEKQRPADSLLTFSDFTAYNFETNMGAMGLSHTWSISDSSILKTSLAIMGQQVVVQDDTVNLELNPTMINREDFINSRISISSIYSKQMSKRLAFKAGLFASNLIYNLEHDSVSFVNFQPQKVLSEQGNTFLLQPFFQFSYQSKGNWRFYVGAHGLYLTLNNTYAVDPRAGVLLATGTSSTLSLAYGLHSRTLPIGSYFTQIDDGNGNVTQPNLDLKMPRAHHLVLSFNKSFGKDYRFRAEAYYQYMSRVPVSPDSSSTYWIFNDVQGYATQELVSEGLGRNMGIDVIIEKFLGSARNGSFFSISGSIFDSRYQAIARNEWYNTQYNSGFSAAFFAGKEWQVGTNNRFQLGLKALYNAGLPLTPLLEGTDSKFPPEDATRPFAEDIEDYFRPDLRLAFTKNGQKTSWTLALDIQNVINRRNVDGLNRTYDSDLNTWVFRQQSGLTPLISFQLDL